MVIKSKPHIKKIILNEILIHPLLVNFIPQKKSLRTNGSVDKMSVLKMLQTEGFLYVVFYSNIVFSCQITCSGLWSLYDVHVESEH